MPSYQEMSVKGLRTRKHFGDIDRSEIILLNHFAMPHLPRPFKRSENRVHQNYLLSIVIILQPRAIMGEVEYLKKLEQFLFYFLFFAIPFQARKILYYPGWYFNEWQSVSVYATDLILLILFVFWAVGLKSLKAFFFPGVY